MDPRMDPRRGSFLSPTQHSMHHSPGSLAACLLATFLLPSRYLLAASSQLGMTVANFAKSMVGMEEYLPPLASNDEAASSSREGAEHTDDDGVVIVSEDGLEIGYAYPSFHLGVKRHVLGTSQILGINRHLLGTHANKSQFEFAEPISRNSSEALSERLSRHPSEGVSPGSERGSVPQERITTVTFAGGSLDAISAAGQEPPALESRDLSGVQLSMLRPSAYHLDIKPAEKPAPPPEKPPPMP
jgi:hypothetical protein